MTTRTSLFHLVNAMVAVSSAQNTAQWVSEYAVRADTILDRAVFCSSVMLIISHRLHRRLPYDARLPRDDCRR